MQTNIYESLNKCICKCTYVYILTYIFIYIFILLYLYEIYFSYTYIYTHIHTHIYMKTGTSMQKCRLYYIWFYLTNGNSPSSDEDIVIFKKRT